MNRNDVFLSAIKGADGSVNPGYLTLFKSGQAVIVVIFLLVIGSFVELAWSTTHAFNVQPLGVAIGAVLGAYGLLLGGIAGFLWGDSKSGTPGTTVEHKETITTTASAPVAPVVMQPGVEPLSPKIGPEDVGKSVAIVPPRKANARKARRG